MTQHSNGSGLASLVERRQCVVDHKFQLLHQSTGIPRRSVLELILFITYMPGLVRLIERHGLRPHLCADDTQIYSRCSLAAVGDLAAYVAACIDDTQGGCDQTDPSSTLTRRRSQFHMVR
jgi:hypothetical protein